MPYMKAQEFYDLTHEAEGLRKQSDQRLMALNCALKILTPEQRVEWEKALELEILIKSDKE